MSQIKLAKCDLSTTQWKCLINKVSTYYIWFIVEGHELTDADNFKELVTYLYNLNMTINLNYKLFIITYTINLKGNK
jgi:hypothetical protein